MDLSYPIGKFNWSGTSTPPQRAEYIGKIASAPAALRAAIKGLSPAQFDTPYRPEGWTVRQVVHHVPESHMNAYIRFKLTLTEDEPAIKPYMEDRWVKLADVPQASLESSLALLENLHLRWVTLLKTLGPADFSRTFKHPELGVQSLDRALAMYAWHGAHHTAHITTLRDRMGWSS
jgi:hypothetical protein